MVHTCYSHIQWYASFPTWFSEDNVVQAGKSRKAVSNLVWQCIQLRANCIVCPGEEVLQDRVVAALYQIL